MKVGSRIRCILMRDDPEPVPGGTEGTVLEIREFSDWTQIWVKWDNGRSLALCVPPDVYQEI